MKPQQKSILISFSVVLGLPLTVFLLILFRDFIYLAIFIICCLICLTIGSFAVYEAVHEELTKRSRIHEQLYHGKSPEVRRWLDFFLKYFRLEELR